MSAVHLAIAALLALPAAAALPALCGSDCRIDAASFPGYDPAVALIESGASVTWRSVDITHVTQEAALGVPACFTVHAERGEDAPAVRFDIDGGVLKATTGSDTEVCASAAGDGAGGFVLHYFCVLHPTMRAALLVTG